MSNDKINVNETIKINNEIFYTKKIENKIKYSDGDKNKIEYITRVNFLKILIYVNIKQEFEMIYAFLQFKKFVIELCPGLFFIGWYYSYDVDRLVGYRTYSVINVKFEVEKVIEAKSYNDLEKGKIIFHEISDFEGKDEIFVTKDE